MWKTIKTWLLIIGTLFIAFGVGASWGEKVLGKKIIQRLETPIAQPFIGDYWVIPERNGVYVVNINREMGVLADGYSKQKQIKGKSK